MIGRSCGRPATPGLIVFMCSAGEREHEQDAGRRATAATTGRLSDLVDHPAPHARLAVVAVAQAADERHAALLDVVAELGQDRGEDGDAADHRDGDDEHRADGEAR